MVTRAATVEWTGNIRDGQGLIDTGSGAVHARYSIHSRMADGAGSNPEELLGAAHGACFTMAVAAILGTAGLAPIRLQTRAVVTLDGHGADAHISGIELTLVGVVPGIDEPTFRAHAEKAKATCPLSRALAAIENIQLHASLEA